MKLITFVITCSLFLFFYSCQKSDPEIGYQFPLEIGNSWTYLYTTTYNYTWSDSIVVQNDTLKLSVVSISSDSWYNLKSYLSTPTLIDSVIVTGQNGENGFEVLPYNNFLGFVTNSVALDPHDTSTLMLPISNEVVPITQGEQVSDLTIDTLITGPYGIGITCKHLISSRNSETSSHLFYNEVGIIGKRFSPDTLIVGLDTVIVQKTISLDSYTLNQRF